MWWNIDINLSSKELCNYLYQAYFMLFIVNNCYEAKNIFCPWNKLTKK